MKLTILGSGTYIPNLKRKKPSCVLSIGRENIIIDMGSGTFDQLYRAGFNYRKINYIFITHTHPDHVSDLIAFIQAYYADKHRGVLKKKLEIIGPKGFKSFYKNLTKTFSFINKCKFIKVYEINKKQKLFPFGMVKSIGLKHATDINTIGYKFYVKTKSVVIAGDTGYCDSIVDLAKNTNLLLIEAAVPIKVSGHLTPAQAGEIAQKAKVKKLVLTHFYPEVEKINIRKEAAKNYKGPIILARDLMEIKI